MSEKNYSSIENWIDVLVGVLPVSAIFSIFKNDASKIISEKGQKTLSNIDRMKDIENEIKKAEDENKHGHILI